jgi:rhodanese-related sulfurtransferase
MKTIWFFCIITALVVTACSPSTSNGVAAGQIGKVVKTAQGQYYDISVPELETMLKNKDFTFVNVHIPFEGNIPNTDISIPYDTIDQHLDQLPTDKKAKIVLYCRTDRMSNIAANTLVEKGYTNIFNLVGGFTDWEKAGLPIEK